MTQITMMWLRYYLKNNLLPQFKSVAELKRWVTAKFEPLSPAFVRGAKMVDWERVLRFIASVFVFALLATNANAKVVEVTYKVSSPYLPAKSYKSTTPPFRSTQTVALGGLEEMICQKFKGACRIAIAVARAESGLVCNKRSYTANTDGSYDHGLFQINDRWHMPKFQGRDPYDCQANIDVAYQIFTSSGWYPWSAYKNGAYLKFL